MCIACTIQNHWIPLIKKDIKLKDEIKKEFFENHSLKRKDELEKNKNNIIDAKYYASISQCLEDKELDKLWDNYIEPHIKK